jgi:hypothetical protein
LATVTIPEEDFRSALEACRSALRRIADYTAPPDLNERMLELGENKEFLSEAEHDELMALVNFAQERTLEKFEAQSALKRLEALYSNVASQS